MNTLSKAFDVIDILVSFMQLISKAVAQGDLERLEDILDDELHTTLARKKAEIEAKEKFGATH